MMNLLNCTRRQNAVLVDGTDAEIPLSERMATSVSEGQAVIVGIRPEALHANDAGIRIDVTCDVAEFTGPELLMTGSIGGQTLMASLEPHVRASAGDKMTLSADLKALHFFDSSTELRL